MSADDPIEFNRGAGLGPLLTLAEGRRRLDQYAVGRPLEAWAGPVYTAEQLQEKLGISRSELLDWERRQAVIAIANGEQGNVYPVEQFDNSAPTAGIDAVLAIAPDVRSVWLWLRQSHGALDDVRPLDLLKVGGRSKVLIALERDYA